MPFEGKKPSDRLIAQIRRYQNFTRNIAPRIVGNEARNYFIQSFKNQSWNGMPWPKRKSDTKKSEGRAVLVKSGKLRNSVRIIQISAFTVHVGSELPYAEVHNAGFNSKVNIPEHYRRSVMRYSSARTSLATGKTTTRTIKTTGERYRVKAHTRKMNVPQRRFAGSSPELTKQYAKALDQEMDKIFSS